MLLDLFTSVIDNNLCYRVLCARGKGRGTQQELIIASTSFNKNCLQRRAEAACLFVDEGRQYFGSAKCRSGAR